jgi:hypothetical protein
MRQPVAFFAWILQFARRCGQAQYISSLIWVLIVLSVTPVNRPSGLCLQVGGIVWACAISAGRLSDAGLSRCWAALLLPTLGSPWLFPALIAGANPDGILLQAVVAVATLNPLHIGLVAALFAFPVALGLAPRELGTDEALPRPS